MSEDFKMYETNDYGDTVLPVVDCFGNLVQKYVVRESGNDSQLVPIRVMNGYIEYHPKNVYWVTK